MTRFITKRLLTALGVLFAASYLFYVLAANAGDPLEDLRTSQQRNRDQLIANRTAELYLDVNPFARYFLWLRDAVTGDLGNDYLSGQPVTEMIAGAIGQTLQLIGFASIAAIIIGVTIGIVTALRQYSGFDYGVTVANFVLYSLPSFWVAVLLKQWGAIGFNDFLENPHFSWFTLLAVGAVLGITLGAAFGGPWLRRLAIGGGVGVFTAALLWSLDALDWFRDPRLGPVLVLILGVGFAFIVTFLSAGLSNRKALYTSLTMAVAGAVLWFPFSQFIFGYTNGWAALGQVIGFAVGGYVVGLLFGGDDKKVSARTGAITGALVFGLLWLDNLMSYWQPYNKTSTINWRPIATVGSETPQLAANDNYWVGVLDTLTHTILPVTAIILISIAGYTRYMRASMLEVMNLDYIRTARAKGLPERTVVMRHGFRNALIPLATIIPLDLAALVGGAVITETIFSWNGMGRLFVEALHTVNVNVLMGYFLVTGLFLIIGNIIADLMYAILDPRIRVEA